MRPVRLRWRPWDQRRALANARAASVELSQARVAREEVTRYLAAGATSRGSLGTDGASSPDERRHGGAFGS